MVIINGKVIDYDGYYGLVRSILEKQNRDTINVFHSINIANKAALDKTNNIIAVDFKVIDVIEKKRFIDNLINFFKF